MAFALDRAGIPVDTALASDFQGLTTELANPDVGHAFISNPCCFFDSGTPAALADFIARGNKAHLSYWELDADPVLQDIFNIRSAFDFFVPQEVHDNAGHPSWADAESPVRPLPRSPWGDNGDFLTVTTDAQIVSTFASTTGEGATAVANDGSTLLNGFDYDSMEDDRIQALLAAQANWLIGSLGPICYPDFDEDGQLSIFDFLAFQSAFDSGDPAADCDEDGELTLFDFFCFQNLFAAGCG
ncbi:MAG: GC-type dockerin domain-anchored protein [Phycisphaerales bacterium JB060]